MIEEIEARARILTSVRSTNLIEEVDLGEAVDRFCAREILGTVDLPGFDNSSMDGYAVRARDAIEGAILKTGQQSQPAGADQALSVAPGWAVRLFTGAPIPQGADAVIMQEDVEKSGDGETIRIVEGVEVGESIRPRGADICAGQRILEAGDRITPARVGLLASQGFSTVAVKARPRVGIVTTGDELVAVGSITPSQLPKGNLYNSNGPMLMAQVRQRGGLPVHFHAADDPEILASVLKDALDQSDLVLVAGGVSVGDRDFVKEVLGELGVTTDFWRVKVKPGKPFLFGSLEKEDGSTAHVFGLPGNPVSAFVTFHLFAAPAMAAWSGDTRISSDGSGLALEPIASRLLVPLTNPGDRPHYLRMMHDRETGGLKATGLQQSHALFGLSRATALLRLDPGASLEAGDEVVAWQL